MMTVSVIIPTYNRPDDLRRCIESIIRQIRRPDEIVVVDDGHLESLPLLKECDEAGIQYIYHKKDPAERGQNKSRNIGVRISSGDILVFLDDDVELFPDFIKEIAEIYEQYNLIVPLGGVSGSAIPLRAPRAIEVAIWLFQVFFLLSPLRPGRVTCAGFSDQMGVRLLVPRRPYACEICGGGLSSFHRRIFEEFSFDESLYIFSQGEDKDFSWQVSRRYKIITTPQARLYHHESPTMRRSQKHLGEDYILSSYRFFCRYKKKGALSHVLFFYAATGYLVKWYIFTLLSPKNTDRKERLNGIMHGIKSILGKKNFTCF